MNISEGLSRNFEDAEHVRFLRPVAVSDVVEVARHSGRIESLDVPPSQERFTELSGVSDGRRPAKATLCFVDKAPDASSIDSLRKGLVVTSPALAPALVGCAVLIAADPRALFIDLLARLAENPG